MILRPIIIFLFSCLAGMPVHAQPRDYAKKSLLFLSELEQDSLIRGAAAGLMQDRGMPKSVFYRKYAEYRPVLQQMIRKRLPDHFRVIDKKYKTVPAAGSESFRQIRAEYVRELESTVRASMLAQPSFMQAILLHVDETDRILSFHSDIKVHSDGRIIVDEQIEVYNGNGVARSSNDEIQRGIRRSFPTRYKTAKGFNSSTGFRVLSVTVNGDREIYELKKAPNGVDMYIGNPVVNLDKGVYTYGITYETERQLIFHNQKDELYWNVNGNGWSFSCDSISALIQFPKNARIMESACYTGVQGSASTSCRSRILSDSSIFFSAIGSLMPFEGLTIAASVEKGVVSPPSQLQNAWQWTKDNLIVPVMGLFVLLFLFFHFRHWWKVGRDPRGGTVIPRFAPPAGFSPADAGYLYRQAYSEDLFAASVIDHAVNRRLIINVSKEGVIFKSTHYAFDAPPGSQYQTERHWQSYEWYGYDVSSLYGKEVSNGTYNASIAAINRSLHQQLKNRMLKTKGRANSFKSLFSLNDQAVGIGIFVLFLLGFGGIIYLAMFGTKTLVLLSAALWLVCLIIQIVFMRIIKAYTPEGRKYMDEVQGFRMYLATAEQHVYDAMNPPEKNLQLFEKYLPYAIALNCEQAWSDQFADVLESTMQQGQSPSYLRGVSGSGFRSAGLYSGISSGLSGAISSASTPPSSSSGGSSGGGSSGGGGGGGGGGGW